MQGRKPLIAILVAVLLIFAGVGLYTVIKAASGDGGAPSQARGASDTVPRGPTASDALARATPLITSGAWDQAIVLLDKAVANYPGDRELRATLARCEWGAKRWDKAVTHFEAALKIGPESGDLHAQAALACKMAGKLPDAVAHYTKACALEPNNHTHAMNLGMLQIKAGDDDAAMVSLLRSTVIRPDVHEVWGSMAGLELKANRPDVALQHIEKARKLAPEYYAWRLLEARAYARKNEPQRAYDLLAAMDPKDRYSDGALQTASECLGMLRRPLDAAKLYEAAAIARPEDTEILGIKAREWRERVK